MFEFANEKAVIQDRAYAVCVAIDAAADELRAAGRRHALEEKEQRERRAEITQDSLKLNAEVLAFELEKRDLRATVAVQREEIESLKRELESVKAQAEERDAL